MKVLEKFAGALIASTGANVTYSPAYIDYLQVNTSCVNIDEIQSQVNYTGGVDPYPEYDTSRKTSNGGYNTERNLNQNCYVEFVGNTSDYRLLSLENNENHPNAILTHSTPCGVCSTLDQLAVYLKYPDLTTPVKKCAAKFHEKVALECLAKLGFKSPCQDIWLYNSISSRDLCTFTCILNLNSPNNVESGGTNYCEPWSYKNTNGCKNTINGQSACSDFQWEEGQEYRLNSCLQCDECRSGPVFQKVAGRTRRASGIDSAIKRPPDTITDDLTHCYPINGAPACLTSAPKQTDQ